MPTSYTSLLGLALPVTGELSGTWGDTVNDYITQYLDASVAGTQTISGSQTAVTLSKTTATSLSQAGSGATGSSQYNIINCTGNPASMLTVTVPAASKTYVVVNATSTNQDVKIVGAGPTTGVTLVAGEKAVIAWNGSDFIKIATSTADGVTTLSFGSTGLTPSTATSGAVTVAGTLVAANGGTGQSTYTTGDLLYATGSTALSKLGIGTNGQILTSTGTAPQWSTLSGVAVTTFSAGTTGFTPSSATSGAVTLAGTLATTNGGTGLTSFTANGVVYASSTSALTTGSALTFDGTTFATTGRTSSANGAWVASGAVMGWGAAGTFTNYIVGDTASNYLLFQVNSAEGMRLTSTGLGIGTSSPSVKLDVFGRAKIDVGTYASGYALTLGAISETGRTYQIGMVTGGSLAIYDTTAAAQRVVLDSSGNLGIGTSSPGSKLDVSGGTTTVNITSTTTSAGAIPKLRFNHAGNDAYSIVGGGYMAWLSSDTTERMRLDSSGNLGLGVTPSAWGTSGTVLKAFQVGQASSFAAHTAANNFYTNNNAFYDGTNWKYINSSTASGFWGLGSEFRWMQAASGTAGNAISFTQAMTLDASGNLALGTTTATNTLTVQGSLAFNLNGTTDVFKYFTGGAGLVYAGTTTSTAIGFITSGGERARITSGGKLGLNTTSPSGLFTVYNTTAADFTSQANLENSSAITINSNQATSVVTFQGATGNVDKFIAVDNYGGTQYFSLGYQNGATRRNVIQFDQNDTIYFSTAGTERARITSVGNFSLGGSADRGTTVGSAALQLFNGTAPAGTLTNGVSLYSSSGDLNFMNSAGNGFRVGYRNLPPVGTQTGSYTLAAGDVGKYVQVSTGGSITIPTSVFAEGDAISIYNNTTGSITITCSAPTAYIAGTNTVKTSMTLATRGVATVLFYSATACVVSGNVS